MKDSLPIRALLNVGVILALLLSGCGQAQSEIADGFTRYQDEFLTVDLPDTWDVMASEEGRVLQVGAKDDEGFADPVVTVRHGNYAGSVDEMLSIVVDPIRIGFPDYTGDEDIQPFDVPGADEAAIVRTQYDASEFDGRVNRVDIAAGKENHWVHVTFAAQDSTLDEELRQRVIDSLVING